MSYAFITGIPASGKTYLAKKIASKYNIIHYDMDLLRDELKKDLKIKSWVDYYWNKDEAKYYAETSCSEQWEILKKQSEIFWPKFLGHIKSIINSRKPAIFEAVNILPHLAHKDLAFKGIVLLGETEQVILERIKKEPRW